MYTWADNILSRWSQFSEPPVARTTVSKAQKDVKRLVVALKRAENALVRVEKAGCIASPMARKALQEIRTEQYQS